MTGHFGQNRKIIFPTGIMSFLFGKGTAFVSTGRRARHIKSQMKFFARATTARQGMYLAWRKK